MLDGQKERLFVCLMGRRKGYCVLDGQKERPMGACWSEGRAVCVLGGQKERLFACLMGRRKG